MEPTNPTVPDLRQDVKIGDLSAKSRHTSYVGPTTKVRSRVLFPGWSKELNKDRQQTSIPDRRYGTNNMPEMETMYYHEVTEKPVVVTNYVYRKHGLPYIPAWQVVDGQVGKNFFDADPSNSTSIGVPDLYYQQSDRDANPRTIEDNMAAKVYDRQMEVTGTNYLLRHANEWNRLMIKQYARQNPSRFYRPIFADEIKREDRMKHEEKKMDSGMLRDSKGRMVPKGRKMR
jgi:hypothetical protein